MPSAISAENRQIHRLCQPGQGPDG